MNNTDIKIWTIDDNSYKEFEKALIPPKINSESTRIKKKYKKKKKPGHFFAK